MNKKLMWIIIILVAIIGILITLKATGKIGKDEGIEVNTEKAAKRTIIETVNASGKVYPEIEVKVSSDISGEIVELKVEEGDSVRKGQEVARIYADIYASQRDQVAAGVTQAGAQVSNTQAALEAYKANLSQAEAAYNRQKKLLADKVISASEFEQSEQAYKSAKANYAAALETIKGGQASYTAAQAQLQRANKDLSRATITAPMDGIVSLLSVKKGERVVGTAQMTGTEMMRIADMHSIVAQVDVGENDITKVKLGDTAIIEVDAYNNRKFKGLVYKIANPITSTSASSNEVTTYKVHIRLFPSEYKDLIAKGKFPFRPGMSANADIQTKKTDNVLSIPLNAVTTRSKDSSKAAPKPKKENTESDDDSKSAVNTDDLQEVVFIYDSKTLKVRKAIVKTDIQDLNYIQIVSGLKEGEEVVTGPYNIVSKTLKEGDKVKVIAAVKPAN